MLLFMSYEKVACITLGNEKMSWASEGQEKFLILKSIKVAIMMTICALRQMKDDVGQWPDKEFSR